MNADAVDNRTVATSLAAAHPVSFMPRPFAGNEDQHFMKKKKKNNLFCRRGNAAPRVHVVMMHRQGGGGGALLLSTEVCQTGMLREQQRYGCLLTHVRLFILMHAARAATWAARV